MKFRNCILINFVTDARTDGPGGEGLSHFSAYVGSGPASTIHPQKYQKFQAPQKNI